MKFNMNAAGYIQKTKSFFDSLKFNLPDEPKNVAIIIETRIVKNFGTIVRNHLHFLPKDFGLIVCHGADNKDFIESELEGINNYSTMLLPYAVMTEQNYNSLLSSYNFWRVISAEKALVFQSDSLLLRKGIEQFLEYNYIGAPWKQSHVNLKGGNGGLSIRNVELMKHVTKNVPYDYNKHGNEDLYFCRHVPNLPENHIAQQFSVETVFYPTPIGIHACDKHLDNQLCKMLFEKALKEIQ